MSSQSIRIDPAAYKILETVKAQLRKEGNVHADFCDAVKRLAEDAKKRKEKEN